MKRLFPVWCGAALFANLHADPSALETASELVVTGLEYRITFQRYTSDFDFELRDKQAGGWRRILKKTGRPEFGVSEGAALRTTAGNPARLRHSAGNGCVTVGLTALLSSEPLRLATMHFLCADEGALVSFQLAGPDLPEVASCWALPRLPLEESMFGGYTFWRDPDEPRSGTIAGLGERNAYAGVSAWGVNGDTAKRLSAKHPALIAQSQTAGTGLGVVFLRSSEDWSQSHSFLQRYRPGELFLYSAIVPVKTAAQGNSWAWLAPFPESDPAKLGISVERLLQRGEALRRSFQSVAPEAARSWTEPVRDFPAVLRRSEPVKDIRDAVVYTVHETMESDDGIRAGAKVGSDLWIRAWFKWRQARDYGAMAHLVPKAHGLGALFGGGITCSALYQGENGLTEAQVLDMATRGADGQLVNAWGESDCRHGTLSNPAYLEYLLSWCRKQIDAGVDYLFMDEPNAALHENEGFDDYSLRDFRASLIRSHCEVKGWTRDDARWNETYRVDLADRDLCPAGTIDSFDYRAYLRKSGFVSKPHDRANPFAADWHAFRRERDDRAWKWLTDAIRAYAKSKGRHILISGNGLIRSVDLQVLGVWGLWRVRDGAADLEKSQLDDWASTVAAGRALAGTQVPVVFFHDWGFNGFPWMEIAPPERELWMRVRGAEIYAAGGFFAFPVHGPMNDDALRDGTVGELARQTAFYQQNRSLYLQARLLGFEPLESDAPLLSTALWRWNDHPALVLHVINRQASASKPVHREGVEIKIPVDRLPRSVRIVSPDWEGEKPGQAKLSEDGRLAITIPRLEAYAVAILDFERLPEVRMAGVKTVPIGRWERPDQNEFVVQPGGVVRDAVALPAFLQGNLHAELRNPPTFRVSMPRGGKLRVHVRAVATLGARLECLMDDAVTETADLPDLDHKNDSGAAEYDRTFEFAIPQGRHRVTLRNSGGDWAYVAWYGFEGELE